MLEKILKVHVYSPYLSVYVAVSDENRIRLILFSLLYPSVLSVLSYVMFPGGVMGHQLQCELHVRLVYLMSAQLPVASL